MADSAPATRVALITGGARRVGRAIIEKLARGGFDIAFTYLGSVKEAEELADRLRRQGRESVAIPVDLTDPERATQTIYDVVASHFGRLDVLVNNASIYEKSGLTETNVQQMRRLWAIHVESPTLLCQKFAPMLRAGRGHVINMVDLLAERPWPQYLSYCASKAGLWNLTLGLARELAPEVTVNGIAPGVVEWAEGSSQEEREKYLKRVPLGRPGAPEDVADAVKFLCTRGSYITGQIIRLDGGRSIT